MLKQQNLPALALKVREIWTSLPIPCHLDHLPYGAPYIYLKDKSFDQVDVNDASLILEFPLAFMTTEPRDYYIGSWLLWLIRSMTAFDNGFMADLYDYPATHCREELKLIMYAPRRQTNLSAECIDVVIGPTLIQAENRLTAGSDSGASAP